MRRMHLFAVAVLIVAVIIGFAAGRLQSGLSPTLSSMKLAYVGFLPNEVDLGTKLWGQEIPLKLPFVNRSGNEIVIEDIKASCGCTLIDVKKYKGQVIPPNQVFALEGQLNTEKNPGLKRRTVTLKTAQGQSYNCDITLTVEGTWKLSPDYLDFGEVLTDDTSEAVLAKIVEFSSGQDRLAGVSTSNHPWLECRIADRGGGKSEILVRVLKDQLAHGLNTATILVRTTNDFRPTGVIPVKLRATQSLVAEPPRVLLVGDKPQTVRFKRNDGKPIVLSSAVAADKMIDVHLTASDTIEVVNRSGKTPPEEILTRVSDDSGKCVTIRISCF